MNVVSINDNRGDVTKRGVVAKSGVVVDRCFVAKSGVVTDSGIVAKSGVVAECSIVAEHGVVPEHGVDAKEGIVITKRGVDAEKGIAAKRVIVEVVAVDGVTTKQNFVGVVSMDPTFARLPKEAVNDDFRFLLAWMSVDVAVQSNWSGANTDRLRWLVQWTWRIMLDNISIMLDNISNPDAIRGSEDTRDDSMLRQRGMVGNKRNGRQEEGNAMGDNVATSIRIKPSGR